MTLVAFGLGNIIGTEIFQPKDAPDYIPGKIAILVLLTVQLAICYLLRWLNLRMNIKKKAQLEAEKARRGWSDEEVEKERQRHAFMDLTDKQYVAFPRYREVYSRIVQEHFLRVHCLAISLLFMITTVMPWVHRTPVWKAFALS